MFTEEMNQERSRVINIDFYTTSGVASWWSGERMQVKGTLASPGSHHLNGVDGGVDTPKSHDA